MLTELAGLPVIVFRPANGTDHTLDGVSSRHARLIVVGELSVSPTHHHPVRLFGDDEPEMRREQANPAQPPLVLVRTYGVNGTHIGRSLLPWSPALDKNPAEVLARYAHGGNFAAPISGDGNDATAWATYVPGQIAVPIHDRNESRWRRVRRHPIPGLNEAQLYAPLVELVGPEEAPIDWRYVGALGRREFGPGDLIVRFQHNETNSLLNLGLDGTAYRVVFPLRGDHEDPQVTQISRTDALSFARP